MKLLTLSLIQTSEYSQFQQLKNCQTKAAWNVSFPKYKNVELHDYPQNDVKCLSLSTQAEGSLDQSRLVFVDQANQTNMTWEKNPTEFFKNWIYVLNLRIYSSKCEHCLVNMRGNKNWTVESWQDSSPKEN